MTRRRRNGARRIPAEAGWRFGAMSLPASSATAGEGGRREALRVVVSPTDTDDPIAQAEVRPGAVSPGRARFASRGPGSGGLWARRCATRIERPPRALRSSDSEAVGDAARLSARGRRSTARGAPNAFCARARAKRDRRGGRGRALAARAPASRSAGRGSTRLGLPRALPRERGERVPPRRANSAVSRALCNRFDRLSHRISSPPSSRLRLVTMSAEYVSCGIAEAPPSRRRAPAGSGHRLRGARRLRGCAATTGAFEI